MMGRLLVISAYLIFSTSLLFAQGSYLDIMGIIRGDSLGSQFGKKVVSAGDVNGDSIPDFLVGAFGNDPIYPYDYPVGAEKVYLFYGKKGGLDTLPDLVFEHKAQLESLGDINGDGSLDFAMRESGQKYRLSLYFGGSALDTIPDGYIKGDSSGVPFGDRYGRYVSAGKVSDSGDYQIVVGDPAYDNRGRVYAYHGRGGCFDSTAFWQVVQGAPGGGPAVILGDINGDGFADIGSHAYNTFRVEIYFGKPVLDTIPDLVFWRPGGLLAATGDLNGDGFSDFIAGISSGPSLYFGGNPFDTVPRFTLDRIGYQFINGGDINADGYTDLLVGRDEYPLTGYAYVYYGGPNMDRVVDLQIDEHDLRYPSSGFGQTVAGLGDIDSDGSNDFAVGSTSNTDPDQGYLWVFRGLLPTGVNDGKGQLPKAFALEQNYPNPFNSNTVIRYVLSKRSFVSLKIFNIAGQTIRVLQNQEQSAGSHRVNWDGTDSEGRAVSSGIYLYYLKAGEETETKKMILIR